MKHLTGKNFQFVFVKQMRFFQFKNLEILFLGSNTIALEILFDHIAIF